MESQGQKGLINLKTGVAYKPRITPTLMRGLASPRKAPQGRKSWEDGQGRPPPDRVGCWTAQPHGDGKRKQELHCGLQTTLVH